MTSQQLRYWLQRKPMPVKILIYNGETAKEYEKDAAQNWGDVARTIISMEADRIEVFDAKNKIVRACRLDGEEDEQQAATAGPKAPYDAETERMRVIATLIAEAYKFAVGVAFEKLVGILDSSVKASDNQTKALYEMNRLLGKAYQEQVDMAFEQAEERAQQQDDPVTGLIGHFIAGQNTGTAERVAAAAGKTNGAKAPPKNGKVPQV